MKGSLEWARWLQELNTQTSGVSKEVIESWTQWFSGDQDEPNPELGPWRDAIPNSISVVTDLIQRLRQFGNMGAEHGGTDEFEMLTRRIELLERELQRLKERMPSDESVSPDSEMSDS